VPKALNWPKYWQIVYRPPGWIEQRQRTSTWRPCRLAGLSIEQIEDLVRREIEDHTGPAADGENAPIWRVG